MSLPRTPQTQRQREMTLTADDVTGTLGQGSDRDTMREARSTEPSSFPLALRGRSHRAVAFGIDSMDSSFPTKLARHGTLLVRGGRVNVKRAEFRSAFRRPEDGCGCATCADHTLVRAPDPPPPPAAAPCRRQLSRRPPGLLSALRSRVFISGEIIAQRACIASIRGSTLSSLHFALTASLNFLATVPHLQAYLHHLHRANEPLLGSLASVHNLHRVNELLRELREGILAGRV